MSRIVGIDPGSVVTGYGVLDAREGQLRFVHSGCLRLPKDNGIAPRLKMIFEGLTQLIKEYDADEMAIEQVFLSRNPASALKLGQARGAAICAGAAASLPVAEYAATEVKQALVGRGRADKVQVQHMTAAILGLTLPLQADAADALAVAVTHAHIAHTRGRTGIRLRGHRR